MNKSLLIDRNTALKPQDSLYQTYGCRYHNPDNCAKNAMENICAFVKADKICKQPPKSWAEQYEKLMGDVIEAEYEKAMGVNHVLQS